jgi:nucleotide-binding universal stress UspA family protein
MEKTVKVVIPTDFTVQGDYAYVMVKNMAKKMPIEVTFLNVLNVPDTVTMGADGSIQTCGEIDIDYVKQQKEMAENKMKALKMTHGDAINTEVVLGKTTTGIVDFARENNFDLIGMGTKGTSGITERVVGSEAQLVARKSTVPVLSLMCDRSDFELQKIVLVYDFKYHEKQNLGFLTTLMEVFNTEIHLLQIRSSQALSQEEVEKNMALFAQNNGIEKYVAHVLKESDLEQGVIHFNQMNNMDMVWVGTHGTGGLFHSSAAESLINHMYKPVVSFRIK